MVTPCYVLEILIPASRLPPRLLYQLSAIGHFSVTLGRTVHASVTFDVTLGNAKTLGKRGVVTLSRPIYPYVCAHTVCTITFHF